MPAKMSVLCVHGVGHGDQDAALKPAWTAAITKNLQRSQPDLEVDCRFLEYDDLFDHEPINGFVYGKALAELLASGFIHGIGDLFDSTRGLLEVPDQIRWTAGMVAQWASEGKLRAGLRKRVLDTLRERPFSLVCAHSLGSLGCYDAFRRNPGAVADKTFMTFGSQIGNPCVRDVFAGRIEPLNVRRWYHLFNRDDHVLTAHIRIEAPNFAEVLTEFDKPGDVLNHDPLFYFNHKNTRARVWPDVAGGRASRSVTRAFCAIDKAVTSGRATAAGRPDRRALLVGINDYPNPANRLEGCVNDVFLMSAVLQERGFDPGDIRIVLNDRATTSNVLERLHWLLDHVPADGERVLFYSGHGAQIPSYSARGEVDRLDECLVPYDFDWNPEHAIRDKQFVEFYSQLPYTCRFVAIFDCCHSGGLTREGGLRPRGLTPPDDIRHRTMQWDQGAGRWHDRAFVRAPKRKDRICRGAGLRGLSDQLYDRERKALDHKGSYMPVIYEACQERQLSYEYRDGASSYGAFTFSLAKALRAAEREGHHLTFRRLAERAAGQLKALNYDQRPNLDGPKQILGLQIPWSHARRKRA
jgi:metacaspase-1